MTAQASNFLALDVGTKRIGVAFAQGIARMPRELTTITFDDHAADAVKKLVAEHGVGTIVVGLPRSMSGTETDQSKHARAFAYSLEAIGAEVVMQDETLSTVVATQRRGDNAVGTVDETAAVVILEDYLEQHPA